MNERRKAVIEKLIDAIHHDNIVSKGRLPSERKLSQLLNEKRMIVREALISLEAIGILDIRDRQGIYILSSGDTGAKAILHRMHDWPADVLSRVVEMRQIFEPPVIAIAATRRGAEDIQKLKECLEKMRALRGGRSEEADRAGIYWNKVYHTILIASAGNPYVTHTYEIIMSMQEESLAYMRSGTLPVEHGGKHAAFEEHELLFNAIQTKDADEAEKIAEAHISHTVKAMISLGQIAPSSDIYSQKLAGRLRFKQ